MITVLAKIKLYKEGRKMPFFNGYRPVFNFVDEVRTSGRIDLLDRKQFAPGDVANVQIVFLHREFLGDHFDQGAKFVFGESPIAMGEGEILKIISDR